MAKLVGTTSYQPESAGDRIKKSGTATLSGNTMMVTHASGGSSTKTLNGAGAGSGGSKSGGSKSKGSASSPPGGVNMNKMILTNLTVPNAKSSMVFYGILPDTIQDIHKARFDTISIAGRSSNLHAFSGGDSRSTSITFTVHEDYLAEFNGGTADIRDFVANLKALTYPVYRGTATIAPRCELKIGSFFRIKGICQSCSITWKKPIRDSRYIVADISLDFEESLKQAVSMTDVIALNDFVMV